MTDEKQVEENKNVSTQNVAKIEPSALSKHLMGLRDAKLKRDPKQD